jgi:hypothetical protein
MSVFVYVWFSLEYAVRMRFTFQIPDALTSFLFLVPLFHTASSPLDSLYQIIVSICSRSCCWCE